MFLLLNNGPCGSLVVSDYDMQCLLSCSPTKWHEVAWFGAENERIHGSFTHYKCISDHAVLRTSFNWQSRKFLMDVDVREFKWIVGWKTVRGIRPVWYLRSQRCAVQQSSWKLRGPSTVKDARLAIILECRYRSKCCKLSFPSLLHAKFHSTSHRFSNEQLQFCSWSQSRD